MRLPAVTRLWGFMLCCFLGGVIEGPFLPVVALMTLFWYTKAESPLRMGIWHAGVIISNLFSGLLAACSLTNMDDIGGSHASQWLLLFGGIALILLAITGFWLLPDFPNNTGTYYFTEEEQQMSQYRVLMSAGGNLEYDECDMLGLVWMAVKDPLHMVLRWQALLTYHCSEFEAILSLIVGILGLGTVETFLVQASRMLSLISSRSSYLGHPVACLSTAARCRFCIRHPDRRCHHDLDSQHPAAVGE